MPLIVGTAATLIPAGLKLLTARKQRQAAAALRQVDVTPEGVRQNGIMARQELASSRQPGQDEAERRIEQSTDATVGAARMGATNGGSVLAALSKANGQRLAALSALSAQQQAFHQGAVGRAAAANNTQAQWDEKSRSEYNNAKSSLTGAAIANDASAFNDIGNTGAMVAGNAADKAFFAANPAAAGTVLPQRTNRMMLRSKALSNAGSYA